MSDFPEAQIDVFFLINLIFEHLLHSCLNKALLYTYTISSSSMALCKSFTE